MLALSANPDFKNTDTITIDNPYYDLDGSGEQPELWGKDAIDLMIENVLLTEPFERVFNLSFGTPLYTLLFSNFSQIDTVMPQVFSVIEHWVPIKIDSANAKVTPDENNLTLTFQIPYVSNDGLISGIFARRIRK